MSALSKLPNVGKVLERDLTQAGINTPEELRETGAKDAFIRIRAVDPGACIRMLYGLQGAVEGVRDSQLSVETKQDLKDFFRSLG